MSVLFTPGGGVPSPVAPTPAAASAAAASAAALAAVGRRWAAARPECRPDSWAWRWRWRCSVELFASVSAGTLPAAMHAALPPSTVDGEINQYRTEDAAWAALGYVVAGFRAVSADTPEGGRDV